MEGCSQVPEDVFDDTDSLNTLMHGTVLLVFFSVEDVPIDGTARVGYKFRPRNINVGDIVVVGFDQFVLSVQLPEIIKVRLLPQLSRACDHIVARRRNRSRLHHPRWRRSIITIIVD